MLIGKRSGSLRSAGKSHALESILIAIERKGEGGPTEKPERRDPRVPRGLPGIESRVDRTADHRGGCGSQSRCVDDLSGPQIPETNPSGERPLLARQKRWPRAPPRPPRRTRRFGRGSFSPPRPKRRSPHWANFLN